MSPPHETKRLRRIGRKFFWIVAEDQGVASFKKFDKLLSWLAGRSFSIFQVIDLAFEQRIFRVKMRGAERHAANGDNIHSSIRITLKNFQNFRSASHARHAVGHGQQHSKFAALLQAAIDHLAVTWLENVKWEFSAGE